MNLSNAMDSRVVIVTGGARRIGEAIVSTLHEAGFRVVIHCHHSQKEAHALALNCNHIRPNSAHVVTANLGNLAEIAEIIIESVAWGGRLDGLINNAACFIKDEQAAWDELFQINVKTPYALSYAAYPFLKKTEGSIINITDTHSESPLKDYAIYCQSKAALLMQTKALARNFAPQVRVNAVAPGAMMWPEHENALSSAIKEQIIAKTLLKRHGEPQFVAEVVLSLIQNKFITGQQWRVDGGR